MARLNLRGLPDKDNLLTWFREHYPEVAAENIYTHTLVRSFTGMLEASVEGFLARWGISIGRFHVMMMLEFQDNGMKPSEIAAMVGVTQATVTGLLDGLESKGFVKRMDCRDDRRACIVAMTEQGKKFMAQARPAFNCWVQSAYAKLTSEEKDQLLSLISKLQSAFSESSSK